jgi:hypothetical protein
MVLDHLFQQLTKLGLLFLGHAGVGWAGDALCVALLPCVRWARLRSLEPLCMLPCHCIGSDHLFQQLTKPGGGWLGIIGLGCSLLVWYWAVLSWETLPCVCWALFMVFSLHFGFGS